MLIYLCRQLNSTTVVLLRVNALSPTSWLRCENCLRVQQGDNFGSFEVQPIRLRGLPLTCLKVGIVCG